MSSDRSYPKENEEIDSSFCEEQCVNYKNYECLAFDDPLQDCPSHILNPFKTYVKELSEGMYVHEFWWIEERANFLLKSLCSPTKIKEVEET